MAHIYRYSLSWAAHVVAQLRKSYPRATEYTLSAFQIDTKEITRVLAMGEPFWNTFKRFVHKYARTLGEGAGIGEARQEGRMVRKAENNAECAISPEECAISPLTASRESERLEEREVVGGILPVEVTPYGVQYLFDYMEGHLQYYYKLHGLDRKGVK